MPEKYFTNKDNLTLKVTIDADGEVADVSAMPEGFKPEPEPLPSVPRNSDLKWSKDRAEYGRKWGFNERKNPAMPCLSELRD